VQDNQETACRACLQTAGPGPTYDWDLGELVAPQIRKCVHRNTQKCVYKAKHVCKLSFK
jgi:hypothetical protein